MLLVDADVHLRLFVSASSFAGEILKPNTPHDPLPASAGQDSIARMDAMRFAKGSMRTAEIRRNMQKTMQSDAAVFRTQVCLQELLQPILTSPDSSHV